MQSQIENGMAADVIMSAATEQMNNLVKGKYISKGDVVELLENKVVLIAPKKGENKVSSFKDITKADTIALGDPKSVPAGQYAQEILINLKNWESMTIPSSFLPVTTGRLSMAEAILSFSIVLNHSKVNGAGAKHRSAKEAFVFR